MREKQAPVQIELEFRTFCIHTAARRTYETLISQCFKASSDLGRTDLETRMEGLRFFLEHADFEEMRSRYPELSGGAVRRVILELSEDPCKMSLQFGGMTVSPIWKRRRLLCQQEMELDPWEGVIRAEA